MKTYYFKKFEKRTPYKAVKNNGKRTLLFHFFAIIALMLGAGYLYWRWKYSLNPDALWFAIPLIIAETLSYIGTFLFFLNIWSNKESEKSPPPVHFLSEIEHLRGRPDRPVKIDVFIASYNEEVELVRYSIRDAIAMDYPFPDVSVKVYVIDDGRRDGRDPAKENMKKVAEQEGAGYFCREDNEGYKAGNLKNALEQTDSDLFVILDADTRPFTSFLKNTTGYFRNSKLAWVQTPQWFYDTTEPVSLRNMFSMLFGKWGGKIGKVLENVFGEAKVGEDIFGNDPRIFYEIILRRRNYFNAAFCCGAGSIHRREAVMKLALKDYIREVKKETNRVSEDAAIFKKEDYESIQKQSMVNQQLKPFKFHASEDIYTSMMMHCDGWESIQHPHIECKMLSPQDLDSCIQQRVRYATGSLDIAFKDNPFFIKGLNLGQRLCYFNTIWSYFAPLWLIPFLISPIVFFFTLELPVRAFSFDFFKWFISFQLMNTVAVTLGCWGISTKRGEQYYIATFWLMFRSLISAVRGKKVKFNVTPKSKQWSNNLPHIWPHLLIVLLTLSGIVYNLALIHVDAHPSWSGFITNTFWGLFNLYNLSIIILAANWKEGYIHEDKQIKKESPAVATVLKI